MCFSLKKALESGKRQKKPYDFLQKRDLYQGADQAVGASPAQKGRFDLIRIADLFYKSLVHVGAPGRLCIYLYNCVLCCLVRCHGGGGSAGAAGGRGLSRYAR